jgi:hypothetical protein
MALDAQTLITQGSTAYGGYLPQYNLINLALLRQVVLAKNPSAVLDAQTLISQATALCYGCTLSQYPLLELALLAQIVAGGGGGGGGAVCIVGGVGPPGALVVPCNFSAYVQTPGPNYGLWLGDTGTGTWSNVIAQGP